MGQRECVGGDGEDIAAVDGLHNEGTISEGEDLLFHDEGFRALSIEVGGRGWFISL